MFFINIRLPQNLLEKQKIIRNNVDLSPHPYILISQKWGYRGGFSCKQIKGKTFYECEMASFTQNMLIIDLKLYLNALALLCVCICVRVCVFYA